MKEFCRFLKFIFFSIVAVMIEYLIMKVILHYFVIGEIVGKIIALILFVYFDFKLNKKFTFESDLKDFPYIFRLYVFYIIFSIISNSIFYFNKTWLIIILVSIINILFEFYFQKYYIFNESIDTKPIKV